MEEVHGKRTLIKVGIVVLLIAAAILSMTVLTKAASDSAICVKTKAALDEKRATVLRFTEAAAAAATAIAAVPGDTTTPVAEETADLVSCFLAVLVVVFAEECVVMLSGFAAYSVLFPIACALGVVWILSEKRAWGIWAAKFLACAVVIYALIPVSVVASGKVEQAVDSSFEMTIGEAQEITEEINENTDEEGNFLERAWEKVTGGVSVLVEKGKALLIDFIKTIAVLLVTSCVLPVVVLIFMVWLIKMLFRIPYTVPVVLTRQTETAASWEEEREEEYVP